MRPAYPEQLKIKTCKFKQNTENSLRMDVVQKAFLGASYLLFFLMFFIQMSSGQHWVYCCGRQSSPRGLPFSSITDLSGGRWEIQSHSQFLWAFLRRFFSNVF